MRDINVLEVRKLSDDEWQWKLTTTCEGRELVYHSVLNHKSRSSAVVAGREYKSFLITPFDVKVWEVIE